MHREKIAQANAGDGLNVVMCFEGWGEDGYASEQILAIREKQSEAFSLALRGYRIKEFLTDPIGMETSQWMLDAALAFDVTISIIFGDIIFPSQNLVSGPVSLG